MVCQSTGLYKDALFSEHANSFFFWVGPPSEVELFISAFLFLHCRSERCQEIRGGHLLQIFLAQKEIDIFGTKLGSTT